MAGQRAGLAGKRSGLWFEFHRILAEARPAWVVVENVPGLLSSNEGRDFAVILRGLEELGYGVAWRILDAQHFGVPQRRRRVFIVGHLGDYRAIEVLFESESLSGHLAPGQEAGTRTPTILGSGAGTSRPGGPKLAQEDEYLVNAVQPKRGGDDDNDAQAGHLISARNSGKGYWTEDELAAPLRHRGDDHASTVISGAVSAKWRKGSGGPAGDEAYNLVAAPLRSRQHPNSNMPGRGGEDDENIIIGFVPGNSADSRGIGIQENVSPPVRGGGAGAKPTIAFAQNTRDEVRQIGGNLVGALAAQPGMKQQTFLAAHAVRRLMPIECERLQGFPPVIILDMNITRDELTATALAAGHLIVDRDTGLIYRTRGPGGMILSEPKEWGTSVVNGYFVGTLRVGDVRRQVRTHRVVWIAANGIPPEGMAVCHRNNEKADNRLANLYLASPERNSSDAKEDGLYEDVNDSRRKLSEDEYELIMRDYAEGDVTMRDLATKYGVSKSRIHQIIHLNGWTEGHADTQRYRMLGNAVCVPVAEWLGRRIMEFA